MEKQYSVECIDDGAIIRRFGCSSDYENPSGRTVTFHCENFDDAGLLAQMVFDERIKSIAYLLNEDIDQDLRPDMHIFVERITYQKRARQCEDNKD